MTFLFGRGEDDVGGQVLHHDLAEIRRQGSAEGGPAGRGIGRSEPLLQGRLDGRSKDHGVQKTHHRRPIDGVRPGHGRATADGAQQ